MNQSRVIDYNLTIMEFVLDVNRWLKDRIPHDSKDFKNANGKNIIRDDEELKNVIDTMEMWEKVMADPYTYTQYDNLFGYVSSHERGFIVKRRNNDNTMLFAVNDVLIAADKYYRIGSDYQIQELANAIKKYKILRAKNAFERFKFSLMKPQNLLSTKQR